MATVSSRPEVSVILPVYNGELFLERSVNSVLRQTFSRWELLAIDDGSTDRSCEILLSFSRADCRIRVFRMGCNSGPSAARNVGLRQARGQMITYLDCDDEYYPDYLQYVVRFAPKADVLVFGYDVVDHTGRIVPAGQLWTWYPLLLRHALLETNVSCPLGVAHRQCLLERAGFFSELVYISEDWDLWRRFACVGAEFLYLPLKSGIYHIRADSLSRTCRPPDLLRGAGVPVAEKRWCEREEYGHDHH